jgi:hypothetical protein
LARIGRHESAPTKPLLNVVSQAALVVLWNGVMGAPIW